MSQDIIDRLNELLEAERAGVELATELPGVASKGYVEGELKKFRVDEAWAVAGLRSAIVKYGGTPSERRSSFAQKVLYLSTEWERLKLLARGQMWVVKRIDVLLETVLDPDTTTFLKEMREQHLENAEACNRRLDELAAPPSLPYRDLPFARLREAHDQQLYGAWRSSSATVRDLQRAYHQLRRYLDMLFTEVERSRSSEAKTYLAKAREAYDKVDPAAYAEDALQHLDNTLSYGHHAINALLRNYLMAPHDPRDFEVFHDVRNVPFHLIDDFIR